MGVKGGGHRSSAGSVAIADFREPNSKTGEEQMEGKKGIRSVSTFVVSGSEPLSTREEVADVSWSEMQSSDRSGSGGRP
jgi:hypothetical protein